MLQLLKNHPFDVKAHFDMSLVLTFALPKETLNPLLPPCLQLDTFKDTYGFLAAAFVKTRNLRPSIFPEFTGQDFILAGYRIFVRYQTAEGKRLRGLYILKSETNKNRMAYLGNIFTHYNYTSTDIEIESSIADELIIRSKKSKLKIVYHPGRDDCVLPQNSPFISWKEARRFAGPLPHTFTFNEHTNEVLIVKGLRNDWHPRPASIKEYHIPFLNTLNLEPTPALANAFIVENIPYQWKKGKIESWKQTEQNFKA